MPSILSTIAGVVAAVGGGAAIVAAAASWIGKHWADRLIESLKADYARDLQRLQADLTSAAEDRTRKLESLKRHYERQIEEFYGPLFNMVHQIFASSDIQEEILAQVDERQSEQVREYFLTTYFDPMHASVREILRTKLYLIEGSEMPESFYSYLTHAAQERDQRALWREYRIDTSFLPGKPWPASFYDDIREGFQTAMRNYEKCLDGLKTVRQGTRVIVEMEP